MNVSRIITHDILIYQKVYNEEFLFIFKKLVENPRVYSTKMISCIICGAVMFYPYYISSPYSFLKL